MTPRPLCPFLCPFPKHPFYRLDDEQFVTAAELRPGDILQHLSGTARVQLVRHRTGSFQVHNLEVHGYHVFRVAKSGMLVHNAWGGKGGTASKFRQLTEDQASKHIDELETAIAQKKTHIAELKAQGHEVPAAMEAANLQEMQKTLDAAMAIFFGK